MPPMTPTPESMLKHTFTLHGRPDTMRAENETYATHNRIYGMTQSTPPGAVMGVHLPPHSHMAPHAHVGLVKANGAPAGRLIGPHPAGPGLNMSSISSSKHSGSVSPAATTLTRLDQSRDHSHLSSHLTDVSHLSHLSHLSPIPPGEVSKMTLNSSVGKRSGANLFPRFIAVTRSSSCRGALTSLGLLCLVSLLLALLAMTFLVELTPLGPDADSVQEVTLALAALTLSLDLSCLLICAAQFIFAIKLAKSPNGEERMSKYLQKSSMSRGCAVGGFFLSVPVFLTGVILYTFLHFQSTPAILTAIFIGFGIVFCGCAMIHNVFVWQNEKTKAMTQQNIQTAARLDPNRLRDMNASPLPDATVDLSGTPPHELSTLV